MTQTSFKYNWEPRPRDFEDEWARIPDATPVKTHPLAPQQQVVSPRGARSPQTPQKKPTPVTSDPLSTFVDPLSPSKMYDPLSSPTVSTYTPNTPLENNPTLLISGQLNRGIGMRRRRSFLNWGTKKQRYLKKYTTDKNIPVISKIMSEGGGDGIEDFGEGDPTTRIITMDERLRMRLEQLDIETKESKEAQQYMTQQEYIKLLEGLNEELSEAWNVANDRVRSLKIVIKCSKMLSRNLVPQFYPSMFVLVSEVLDTFGKLVFQRIRDKGTITDSITGRVVSKLPPKFTAADVPEDAKEVCRNWFYKVASIRELIGRLSVEMAIIGCNKFLVNDTEDKIEREMLRITKTIRGIGDPMVANYCRLYLARKGHELLPPNDPLLGPRKEREYLTLLYDDMMTSLYRQCIAPIVQPGDQQHGTSDRIDFEATYQISNKGQYLELFTPCVEWLTECIANNAGEDIFFRTLQKYETMGGKQSVFLNAIISSFEPHIISNSASLLIQQIKECDDSTTPRHVLFKTLGEKFCAVPPPEDNKMELLNEIWKHVTKVEKIEQYLPIVEIYIEFVCKNFSRRECNILLADMERHLAVESRRQQQEQERAEEPQQNLEGVAPAQLAQQQIEESIRNILLTILENIPPGDLTKTASTSATDDDFIQVFNMEHFLPIFDRLKSYSQLEVSRGILTAISRRRKRLEADPVIIHSIFDLARTVHDSVNPLTDKDERDKVSQMLCDLINAIEFGNSFERQLSFYVDCRKAFSNFDQVKRTLVLRVLGMLDKTYRIVKGKHTGKTLVFAKACMAYCHITVPSIDDHLERVRLFLLCAQYCASNNLLAQGDVLIETAIKTLRDVPLLLAGDTSTLLSVKSTTDDVVDCIASLCSCLLSLPSHPEHGPLYLVGGLLNVIKEYKWPKGSDARAKCFGFVLNQFSAQLQPKLPYSYAGTISNDELFMEDDTYRRETINVANKILEEIIADVNGDLAQDLDVTAQSKRCILCLELVNHIASMTQLNPQIQTLALNLYQTAASYNNPEVQRFLANTKRAILLEAQVSSTSSSSNVTVTEQKQFRDLLKQLSSRII
jgi:hypothetical protein